LQKSNYKWNEKYTTAWGVVGVAYLFMAYVIWYGRLCKRQLFRFKTIPTVDNQRLLWKIESL